MEFVIPGRATARTRNLMRQLPDSGFSPAGCPGMTTSPSLHRRVDEVAQERADVFALARTLHHEHREHVFGRIDPEEGSGHPVPEDLTGRARETRHALAGRHGEGQPNTV